MLCGLDRLRLDFETDSDLDLDQDLDQDQFFTFSTFRDRVILDIKQDYSKNCNVNDVCELLKTFLSDRSWYKEHFILYFRTDLDS